VSALVCDTSIVVKLLIWESDSELAEAVAKSRQLIAPDLILAEAGNVIWSKEFSSLITRVEAGGLIEKLLTMPLDLRPVGPLLARALAIATELKHPIYDCIYLALAEQLSIPLLTADYRFTTAARRAGFISPRIVSLTEAV